VAQLSSAAQVTDENARFFAAPVPVIVHIISATLYCALGAFQFVPSLRQRRPRWHRYAGRLLVPTGLAAAGSGVWMALFYPRPPADDVALTWMRLIVGPAMIAAIVLGFAAVRRHDFARHRAWMIRGYALGIGAGTQLLTHLPWMLLVGPPTGSPRAVLMALGWLINLAVAEWIIRRPTVRRTALVPVETR
jgi:uncharacterized membrane protein